MSTKLWLDDVREEPWGWIRCRWPEDVIAFLQDGDIDEISLDHDLGDEPMSYMEPERTGMMVLYALEKMQNDNPDLALPIIHIHSANVVAAKRMKEVVRLLQAREHARRVQRQQENANGKKGNSNGTR